MNFLKIPFLWFNRKKNINQLLTQLDTEPPQPQYHNFIYPPPLIIFPKYYETDFSKMSEEILELLRVPKNFYNNEKTNIHFNKSN